jgi:hypothetical protein
MAVHQTIPGGIVEYVGFFKRRWARRLTITDSIYTKLVATVSFD